MFPEYDVIVVGAGHAGCEAAHAAATMGSKVMLVTMNMMTIAQMSCNPAMGGVAKGQIIREIDALGGVSGIISDKSMIQFRMLNRSKGPAMWSPRSQNDRMRFSEEWRLFLEKNPNIDFWQEMVTGIIVKDGKIAGIKTGIGLEIKCKALVLTNGTFLNGIIHIGEKQFGGGRTAERAATGLTEELVRLGFQSGRMKTGTPPRVDGRTIDYSALEEQLGDENPGKFSFSDETRPLSRQLNCHIAYTNQKVHDVLKTGFDRSPMFNGRIKGIGPRYCPSIEDKINRFSERERHQLFIEPEGWQTIEVYINGFSSSLPEDVQFKALREIDGFKEVKMFRPGYAIEYDYFPPTQLKSTLETKLVGNLFFAGQINGTTGYEEAACQGLIAGINAHNNVNDKDSFTLKRSEAYIGVLIDDLINKGTEEPYRMFTSRAEYRILLRQDNADLRLTEIGYSIGLASESRLRKVIEKKNQVEQLIKELAELKIVPVEINNPDHSGHKSIAKDKISTHKLIKRPEVKILNLSQKDDIVNKVVSHYKFEEIEQAEIQIKYESYIEKEKQMVDKLQSLEDHKIPDNFDYSKVQALSAEGKEKLMTIRPQTLGHASRISGVSASDISILMIYLRR